MSKVDKNIIDKKLLLDYRNKYKTQVNEFKKLYNDIKELNTQNNKLQVEYDQLIVGYNKTKDYCNKLGKNFVGTAPVISKMYKDNIIPIYSDYEPRKLKVSSKWLDNKELKTLEEYKSLERKRSKVEIGPDPAKSWIAY